MFKCLCAAFFLLTSYVQAVDITQLDQTVTQQDSYAGESCDPYVSLSTWSAKINVSKFHHEAADLGGLEEAFDKFRESSRAQLEPIEVALRLEVHTKEKDTYLNKIHSDGLSHLEALRSTLPNIEHVNLFHPSSSGDDCMYSLFGDDEVNGFESNTLNVYLSGPQTAQDQAAHSPHQTVLSALTILQMLRENRLQLPDVDLTQVGFSRGAMTAYLLSIPSIRENLGFKDLPAKFDSMKTHLVSPGIVYTTPEKPSGSLVVHYGDSDRYTGSNPVALLEATNKLHWNKVEADFKVHKYEGGHPFFESVVGLANSVWYELFSQFYMHITSLAWYKELFGRFNSFSSFTQIPTVLSEFFLEGFEPNFQNWSDVAVLIAGNQFYPLEAETNQLGAKTYQFSATGQSIKEIQAYFKEKVTLGVYTGGYGTNDNKVQFRYALFPDNHMSVEEWEDLKKRYNLQ